jgi:hypothetical protein
MKTEDIMAGLVPERRSREELNKANELLLKEHRAYLDSWIAQEAVAGPQSSEKQVNEHEAQPEIIVCRQDNCN